MHLSSPAGTSIRCANQAGFRAETESSQLPSPSHSTSCFSQPLFRNKPPVPVLVFLIRVSFHLWESGHGHVAAVLKQGKEQPQVPSYGMETRLPDPKVG